MSEKELSFQESLATLSEVKEKIKILSFSPEGLLLDSEGKVFADKIRKEPEIIFQQLYPVPNRDEDFEPGESEGIRQRED